MSTGVTAICCWLVVFVTIFGFKTYFCVQFVIRISSGISDGSWYEATIIYMWGQVERRHLLTGSVIVTVGRFPVISSYSGGNVECHSPSCKIFPNRANPWFLHLCLKGFRPLSRFLSLAMNRTALCCSITRNSISLANVGFHTGSAYSSIGRHKPVYVSNWPSCGASFKLCLIALGVFEALSFLYDGQI